MSGSAATSSWRPEADAPRSVLLVFLISGLFHEVMFAVATS
jgi:hypothetical protein